MRIVLDILVVVVLVGVLGGIALHHHHRSEAATFPEATRIEISRLQQEINLHAALAGNDAGGGPNYPTTVDPDWFADSGLPENLVVEGERPWLEVAGEAEWALSDPKVRVTVSATTAAFWYNPNLGIVRGRVPAAMPESEALALYNLINQTELLALYE